jgi:hypothetical protein
MVMDAEVAGFGEIAETTSFLHYFSELPDHRQPGKVNYPLPEVRRMTAGCDDEHLAGLIAA